MWSEQYHATIEVESASVTTTQYFGVEYRCSRLVYTLSTISSRSKKLSKIVAVKMHFVRLASISAFPFPIMQSTN